MRPPAEVGLGAGWASLGLGFARVGLRSGWASLGSGFARVGWGVEHYSGFVVRIDAQVRRVVDRVRDSAQVG
ncbi:hypothetical protein SAMN02745244_03691, partial [Tessaracoccus bendigoensis DSM 12906]